MSRHNEFDAVVVGAGPNGLSAAIVMARVGLDVLVVEANDEVGGAVRSGEVTLPGFVHDPYSSVYPLAVGSPFLQSLPLADYGLEWIHSPAPLAHPFPDRPAAVLERSLSSTADRLGGSGRLYESLVGPLARRWWDLAPDILGPLGIPRKPLAMARFGLKALPSAMAITSADRGGTAAALIAGSAAHAGLPLDQPATAAIGLVLSAAGHAVGWPVPRGGAGELSRSLEALLLDLGGKIECGVRVADLSTLPPAGVVLLDLTPRQILSVAGDSLPDWYRDGLRRYRYGVGAFKVDWALSGPIPWSDPECRRATTIHLGGSAEEIHAALQAVADGGNPARPFVIVAQPGLHDESRAPEGGQTAWGYCHVPNGSTVDRTEAIEAQVERFAPGFRELIIGRYANSPADLERSNANLVGGDVNGGAPTLGQMFFRPMASIDPYQTPAEDIFICSASTPPGGGVHGMSGYHAARSALRWLGVPDFAAPDLIRQEPI